MNRRLDELALEQSKSNTQAVLGLLKGMITHTTARQMKWLANIIVKSIKVALGEGKGGRGACALCGTCQRAGQPLARWRRIQALPSLCLHPSHQKRATHTGLLLAPTAARHEQVGLSRDTVLKDYHPDALALFNVCGSLQKVINDLRDPTKRMPRQVRVQVPLPRLLPPQGVGVGGGGWRAPPPPCGPPGIAVGGGGVRAGGGRCSRDACYEKSWQSRPGKWRSKGVRKAASASCRLCRDAAGAE